MVDERQNESSKSAAATEAVPATEEEQVCAAPEDEETPGEAAALAPAPPVNTELTFPATGLYGQGTPTNHFGTAKAIEALKAVGAAWNAKHPDAPIGVGNISKNGGGPLPPHASHQKGVDADVRPMRTDKQKAPVAFTDAAYSRALTQELVDTFRSNTVLGVKLVFFNDPSVTGVQPAAGHHNHLHVRFQLA